MDNFNKKSKEYKEESLKNIKQGGGMVNLYNDFGSTIPNFGAPRTREEAAKMNKDILYGTGFKGTGFDSRTIDEHFENMLQPNENSTYAPSDLAKIMSGDFKNLSPRALMGMAGSTNLTDEEKYLLLESSVGEGIFFAGLKHVAIKIIASYTEDQIITSDPSQVLAIKRSKQEFQEQQGRM